MQFKFFALAAMAGLAIAAPQVADRSVAVEVAEAPKMNDMNEMGHKLDERQTITSRTVIASMNAISDTVEDAIRIVTSLNPITIFFAVPRLIANFGRIVTAVGTDVSAWFGFQQGGGVEFTRSAQLEIRTAFSRFVRVWIRLLEGILGIFSFLRGTPFIIPITTIIQVLARGVIGFAQAIVGFVPEFRQEVVQEQVQLEQTFTVVIERFN